MKNFIKYLFLPIFKKIIFKKKHILIVNYFNSSFSKNVLISYITPPFLTKGEIKHTNYYEATIAANIFYKLGYNVDIISHDNTSINDFSKYSVIYGMGTPLENYFKNNHTKKAIVIFYSTGFNPQVSNHLCTERLYNIFEEKKILFYSSCRIVEETRCFTEKFSDAIIVLGNQIAKNSYLREFGNKKLYNLNAFPLNKNIIDLSKKNFLESKTNFLWFGSAGKVHKGLDLLFDIFINRTDINLHVCCDLDNEDTFWNYYLPLIKNNNNIVLHGYVDSNSIQFQEILLTCGALLFPSVSEGGSPSIITVCSNSGIFPIISKNSSIDIECNGMFFEDLTKVEIESKINLFLRYSDIQLEFFSYEILEYFKKNYSKEKYTMELMGIINEITK